MFDPSGYGKVLMAVGAIVFIVGLLFFMNLKIPFLGGLPGDITIHRKSFTFSFPIVTCILLSLILSILLYLFSRR